MNMIAITLKLLLILPSLFYNELFPQMFRLQIKSTCRRFNKLESYVVVLLTLEDTVW